jgi:hypothetical protein
LPGDQRCGDKDQEANHAGAQQANGPGRIIVPWLCVLALHQRRHHAEVGDLEEEVERDQGDGKEAELARSQQPADDEHPDEEDQLDPDQLPDPPSECVARAACQRLAHRDSLRHPARRPGTRPLI